MHENDYPVGKMCRIFGVSRSGYYKSKNSTISKRLAEKKLIQTHIKQIFADSGKSYGSPRIQRELLKLDIKCSRPRVARYMKELGLFARKRKKYKHPRDPKLSAAPDLLDMNFNADNFLEKWTGDITYIKSDSGWLYLTVVIELFNREIVGYSISREMTAETTTIPALIMAIKRKGSPQIFHSDRGSQYLCSDYKKLLNEDKKIKQSNSYSCYGNAVTESFFKTLKTEMEKKKFKSLEEAKIELFKWIEIFYNRKRMHSSIGYMSPIEFRKKLTA